MTWRDEAATYLRQHEGVISWAYLDFVGLVTIGVGYMVPTADAMVSLDMVRVDSGDYVFPTEASIEDLRAEWGTINSQERAHVASYYKPFCKLRMQDSEIERLLLQTINGFAENLWKRFPALDTHPNSANVGLMDLIYSLGPQGLFHGYPKFCAAVDAKDWHTAAEECGRQKVSPERNAALRGLFLEAA